jgi:hypothetical protein
MSTICSVIEAGCQHSAKKVMAKHDKVDKSDIPSFWLPFVVEFMLGNWNLILQNFLDLGDCLYLLEYILLVKSPFPVSLQINMIQKLGWGTCY